MFQIGIGMVLIGLFLVSLAVAMATHIFNARSGIVPITLTTIGSLLVLGGYVAFTFALPDTLDTRDTRAWLLFGSIVALVMVLSAINEATMLIAKTNLLRYIKTFAIAAALVGSLFFMQGCGSLLLSAT